MQENKSSKKIQLTIISYVFLTFIGYAIIGLPLAILPLFITNTLHFSAITAGIVISLQYLTTFAVRGYAGTIVDKKGPKLAVIISMSTFMVSGIFLILAYHFKSQTTLSLILLIFMRLITGVAEGMIGASPINWAMLKVGNEHTSTAISYNGIASYGALALGAPIGAIFLSKIGWIGISILIFIMGLIGLIYGIRKKPLKNEIKTARKSFMQVMSTVFPFGMTLALAGIGFGTISTFITLYYDYMHWENGAYCLSLFGFMFILARLLFSKSINKQGGIKVTLICTATETIGLLLIWLAPNSMATIIGAGITGLGFSLVFPAMGVEAVNRVSDSNKGSALAAYGLFIDISMGLTGPIIGTVSDNIGMHAIFPFAMAIVFCALILTYFLQIKTKKKAVS